MTHRVVMAVMLLSGSGMLAVAEQSPKKPETDIISIDVRSSPPTKLKDPRSQGLSDNAEIQTSSYKLTLGFKPLVLNGGTSMIGSGLSYERFAFENENWDSSTNPQFVDSLHALGVPLFYRCQLSSPQWSMRVFLTPGLRSDFESVSFEAFRIQGGLIFSKSVGKTQWGWGLVVLDNYGKPQVYPGVSYEYSKGPHKIMLRAPTMAAYTYRPQSTLELGFGSRVSGISARIEEHGPFRHKNASVSAGTIGPQIRWWITKRVSVTSDVGWVYRNKFEIVDAQGDVVKDYDLKQSWYGSVGLKVGL